MLDIAGIALFRGVGMMFMLHQLVVFQHFRIPLRPCLLRLAGGTGGIRLDIIQNPEVA
jgi:hypothetical protein